MNSMFSDILIVVLFAMLIVQYAVNAWKEKEMMNVIFLLKTGRSDYLPEPDKQPDPQLPADYLTEEQVDNRLRKQLGETAYKELIREQNDDKL